MTNFLNVNRLQLMYIPWTKGITTAMKENLVKLN